MLARHAPTPRYGLSVVRPVDPRALALLHGGRVVAVHEDRPLTVGSAPTSDLVVADPHVSGRHARFTARAGRLIVSDLGSTNGVFVRGQRVRDHALTPGDVVVLARRPLLVVQAGVVARHPRAVRWQGIVAADPRSLATLEQLAAVASADAPVWVHGESGTGKEGAAQALHAASPRASGPFVALNCAALPDALAEAELFGVVRGAFTGADRNRQGAFQRASGGTLLLDEVGELSPAVQAKLLRVLETGELVPVGGEAPVKVDVRVVAATWRDLEREADEGRFRFDLAQRLGVLRVDLPPLRARPKDIGPLVAWLLEAQGAPGLTPDADLVAALERLPWRGNVRQLKTQVTRAVLAGDPGALLPDGGAGRVQLPRRSAEPRPGALRHLQAALAAHGGNRSAAARALGVSRSTLYRWLDDAPQAA